MTEMHNISAILLSLQAAIAVVAARDRMLTAFLGAVWGRIARGRARLERLIALWRAGQLPQPAVPRPGRVYAPRTRAKFPTGPGWLIALVREAVPFGTQLEHLFESDDECKAFLAEVPQVGRIIRPLLRMLVAGVVPARVPKPRAEWGVPAPAPGPVAAAGLVVGPGGRLMYV